MKRILGTILVTVLLSALAFPQEDNSIPPIPPKRSKAAKVGAFGGFTPGWLFMDSKPINEFLVDAGGAPLKDDGVFMTGGAGAAYIMLVPNLRVGGLGMSGSIKSKALSSAGIRRDAIVNVGFGGVTVEYVVPVAERLDMAFGTMLGAGGIDITLRQYSGAANTWNGEWDNFRTGNYTENVSREMSGAFFVWIPSFSVEYAVFGYLGVRLGASYVGMSAPSWELDDTHELLGVPSTISGKGFMLNAGVFVGTF
ncbi:MAG: hypothetical protein ACKVRP_03005 [Bacteroidota bacterium]